MPAHLISVECRVIVKYKVEVVQVEVPLGEPYHIGDAGTARQRKPIGIVDLDIGKRGIDTATIPPVQCLAQRVATVKWVVPTEDDRSRARLAVPGKTDEPRPGGDHHPLPVEDRLCPVLKVNHRIRTELNVSVPRYRNPSIDIETPVDISRRLAQR